MPNVLLIMLFIFPIGLLYSTIAPLVLPFVLLFFITHYFVYLHQFLYVYDREFESGGQYFPRSMRHIWTGLFLFQLTMIGILAIQPGGAVPQFVIMIICLVITAFAMGLYDKTFKPMLKYLPVSLANPAVPVDPADINPHNVGSEQIMSKQAPINMSHQVPIDSSDQVRNYPDVKANDLEKAAKDTNLGEAAVQQNREADIPADQHTQVEATTYLHPSLYSQQPTVWLAEDDMGITQRQLEDLRSRNIKATSVGAHIPRNVKHKPCKVVLDEDRYSGKANGVPYDTDAFLPDQKGQSAGEAQAV
jgi:calcium permeable stress-gated cation channel